MESENIAFDREIGSARENTGSSIHEVQVQDETQDVSGCYVL